MKHIFTTETQRTQSKNRWVPGAAGLITNDCLSPAFLCVSVSLWCEVLNECG
jgi:hypothetical protein